MSLQELKAHKTLKSLDTSQQNLPSHFTDKVSCLLSLILLMSKNYFSSLNQSIHTLCFKIRTKIKLLFLCLPDFCRRRREIYCLCCSQKKTCNDDAGTRSMNLQIWPVQESAQGVDASSFLQLAECKGENKYDNLSLSREGR